MRKKIPVINFQRRKREIIKNKAYLSPPLKTLVQCRKSIIVRRYAGSGFLPPLLREISPLGKKAWVVFNPYSLMTDTSHPLPRALKEPLDFIHNAPPVTISQYITEKGLSMVLFCYF